MSVEVISGARNVSAFRLFNSRIRGALFLLQDDRAGCEVERGWSSMEWPQDVWTLLRSDRDMVGSVFLLQRFAISARVRKDCANHEKWSLQGHPLPGGRILRWEQDRKSDLPNIQRYYSGAGWTLNQCVNGSQSHHIYYRISCTSVYNVLVAHSRALWSISANILLHGRAGECDEEDSRRDAGLQGQDDKHELGSNCKY